MRDDLRPLDVLFFDGVPLVVLSLSLVPALLIFVIPEHRQRLRTTVNLTGAAGKLLLVLALIGPVLDGERAETRLPFVPGIELVFRIEPFGLYFLALSSALWLLTTVYAIGYLRDDPHRARFFGFFSLCVTATSGIALSGNLITFLVFYELLTLTTYPLVVHSQSTAAFRGGRTYLRYTLPGGALLLAGVVLLTQQVGPVEFSERGNPAVDAFAESRPVLAIVVLTLLIAGLATKAALVPLHSWLPRAMVAPAPVSALLHAVAVVKAGVFGIVLVVDNIFGVRVADELGFLLPLSVVAALTIVYGSLMALRQVDIKARLAYSTVSQVAYVTLGVALPTVAATTGAVAHIAHQGLMKITLFFCAGILALRLGVTRVDQLGGIGRRMPVTAAAFTIGALGMIGVPPVAGFVSKWYLGVGAVEAGQGWVVAVLMISALLNAAYFLPLVHAMWWGEPDADADWAREPRRGRWEVAPALLVPTAVTATASVVFGLLAGTSWSALAVATAVVERMYGL